jgi:YegS/Rv2252/BmrU family lipid kinase
VAQRFLILYNPTSGRGRPALVEEVARRLQEAGDEVTLKATRGPGDASTLLQQQADDYDVIVAAGGDGTLSEVINGLAGKEHRRLGVIPTGTTNVLAKELKLPTDASSVVETLRAGRTVPVYANRLNDRKFLLWVGAGFDAWVVADVDLALKKRVGKLAYALAALKRWPGYGKTSYQIRVDDHPYQAYSAIVTSGRFYAGRFRLAEPADLSQPHLGVVLFHSPSRLVLLRNLLDLALGRISSSPGIETVTGKSIHLERETRADEAGNEGRSLPGEVVQVDGDPGIQLPVDIEVDERPIQVLVP